MRAFEGRNVNEIEWAVKNVNPASVADFKYTDGLWFTQRKYSENLASLIRAMLQKDPSRRPSARKIVKIIDEKWGRFGPDERLKLRDALNTKLTMSLK